MGSLCGEKREQDDNGEAGEMFPPYLTSTPSQRTNFESQRKEELFQKLKEDLEEIWAHTHAASEPRRQGWEQGLSSLPPLPQLGHAYKAAWASSEEKTMDVPGGKLVITEDPVTQHRDKRP